MNKLAYFRCSLGLPFLLPLVTFPFRYAGSNNPLQELHYLTVAALFFAGIPYGILAIALLLWSRGKEAYQFYCVLLVSPLLMIPILCICGGSEFSFAVLLFGYAYIAFASAGFVLLQSFYSLRAYRLRTHRAQMFSEAMEDGAKEGH